MLNGRHGCRRRWRRRRGVVEVHKGAGNAVQTLIKYYKVALLHSLFAISNFYYVLHLCHLQLEGSFPKMEGMGNDRQLFGASSGF